MSNLADITEPPAPLRAARRVLVVDDDGAIRELLVELLEGDGYQVSSACDGQQALREVMVNWPGLITLDLMMPIMSGWQFLKLQSEYPRLASIPVVVLSAFDRRLGQPDVAEVLPKPFLVEDVLEAVRRLVS